jgi:hypothetical protein
VRQCGRAPQPKKRLRFVVEHQQRIDPHVKTAPDKRSCAGGGERAVARRGGELRLALEHQRGIDPHVKPRQTSHRAPVKVNAPPRAVR